MLKFILERFHLHDLSPKVWWVAGFVVALLTLVQGTLSISEIYHFQLAQGHSTAGAMLMASMVYPLFGVLFGLSIFLLMAIACMLMEIGVAIANGVIALRRLPAHIAAMTAKDWGLVAYMVAGFSIYGGIGYLMWPTAASLAAWLPAWTLGGVSFMSILLVDAVVSMFVWSIALVVLMLLFSLGVALFKRGPKR